MLFALYLFDMKSIFPPWFEPDALEAFSAVAKFGCVSRAAEFLCLAQPALSRKLKKLETKLGTELFVRGANGVAPTRDGAAFLRIIEPLLNEAASGARLAEKALRRDAKDWRIGLTSAFEPKIYLAFMEKARLDLGEDVEFRIGKSRDLLKRAASGDLDAALIVPTGDSAGLNLAPVYEEKICVALPALWPEAAAKRVSIASLRDKPMFWFERSQNPGWSDELGAFLKRSGFAGEYLAEPPEHEVLLARVAFGEGWCPMPASFAAIERVGVAFKPLEEPLALRLAVVWRDEFLDGLMSIEETTDCFTTGSRAS